MERGSITMSDAIGMDTETSLIAPGVLAPPLVCLSACKGDDKYLFKHDDPDLFAFTADAIDKKTTWANGSFDAAVLMRHDKRYIPIIFNALGRGDWHDVLTRDKLDDLQEGKFRFDEDEEGKVRYRGYSLNDVAGRRLDRRKVEFRWRKKGYGKGFGAKYHTLRYHHYWDKPLDEWSDGAKFYAIQDAVLTRDAHRAQPDHGNEAAQNRAALALHLASCRGLRTDNDNVQRLSSQCEEWIEKIRPILQENKLVGKDGKRKTKVAVRRMIDTLGPECELTTSGEALLIEDYHADTKGFLKDAWEKGKYVSVSSPNCIESGDDILRMYGVYSKLQNMLSGTIKDLQCGVYLPIQSRFDELVATGRTASRAPNIQNQRQGVNIIHPFGGQNEDGHARKLILRPDPRGCFKARDGYVFVSADITGAENATLAQTQLKLFGRSKLADALNQGRDMHLWVASIILRLSYEETLGRYKKGDPEVKDARNLAKPANFGFPGGCGVNRFAAFANALYPHLMMDAYKAQRLKNQWLQAWPEMVDYFDYVAQCVDDNGWHWVRHIGVDRVRKRATFTAACNSYFQGLAADGAKAALWEITRRQWTEPGSALAGTYIVNFIHDEIILEVPYAKVEPAARELRDVFVTEFNRFTPDVPVSSSVDAMVWWSKDGLKVFDENDEYIFDLDEAMGMAA